MSHYDMSEDRREVLRRLASLNPQGVGFGNPEWSTEILEKVCDLLGGGDTPVERYPVKTTYRTWYTAVERNGRVWVETTDRDELIAQMSVHDDPASLIAYLYSTQVDEYEPSRTRMRMPPLVPKTPLDPMPFVWDNPDSGEERSDVRHRHPKQDWTFSPRAEFEQDLSKYSKQTQRSAE